MATSYYKLDIEIRESVGKKSTKAIRRDGKIPSTLYFKGDESESIAIDKIKLYQALKSDQRVYEVELGGESQYVMVKAVPYHVADLITYWYPGCSLFDQSGKCQRSTTRNCKN